ncbi:MJ1255/VC2487 family glycosyltransferase [Kaarinaea lacus]
MRILYGVQATGNGHITRARTMANQLQHSSLHVDYLFSGRNPNKLFNMEPFGNYRCYRGLTFKTSKGKLRYLDTWRNNHLMEFVRDVNRLDLSSYDLVLTDFEPITAWAAKIRKIPSIAIGHQYAFLHNVPKVGSNLVSQFIIKEFAPADICLGFHWHHFNNTMLPPLIEPPKHKVSFDPNKILVYLPFDDTEEVVQWLVNFPAYNFHIYSDYQHTKIQGHLVLHPYSREKFQWDLASCAGVISNAGFGLSSEALQYGKKILVKPLLGQMEQLSNAKALLQLKLGDVINEFDDKKLTQWLEKPKPKPVVYPNVAKAIVDWLEHDHSRQPAQLANELWQKVEYTNALPH